MGINFSISAGHLTAKPELRYFRRDNTPYTRFTVAVNRNFSKSFLEKHPDAQTADFIPCIIKGNYASYLVNHCDKGSLVTVKGRLQSRRYTTEAGENRSVLEVNVGLIFPSPDCLSCPMEYRIYFGNRDGELDDKAELYRKR